MNLSSKKWIKLTGLGIIIYSIALVSSIPAHLAWHWFPSKNVAAIHIQGIEGSIWQGKASKLIVSGVDLGKVNWYIHVWQFILGKLALSTHINNATSNVLADLSISPSYEISLQNLSGIIQTPLLNQFTTPVSLQGSLELNISDVKFVNGQVLNITGQINWHDAIMDMIQSVELGEISITAVENNNGTVLNIKNSATPLAIDGTITVSGNGQYKTNLAIFNRDASRADITSMLSMVGKPDATGRVYLKQQGKLL